MKALIMFSLLTLSISHVEAQKPHEVTFRQLSGENLVDLCKSVDIDAHAQASTQCLFYIGGFNDGFNMAMLRFNNSKQAQFCPPDEVTPTQVAKVIVKYGADHPDKLWLNAALFTSVTLQDAYPCQGK